MEEADSRELVRKRRVLAVDPRKCTGCRYCEVVCAFLRSKECGYGEGAIQILRDDRRGHFQPVFCRQCEVPPCSRHCPEGAIDRDPEGYLRVLPEKCLGCRSCLTACPWGVPRFDAGCRRIVLCNLCRGDPVCVQFCGSGALQFVPPEEALFFERQTRISRPLDGD